MLSDTRVEIPRVYDAILHDHLASLRQMAFVVGPRQVGKTTTCRSLGDVYLSWDLLEDREVIAAGPGALTRRAGLDRLSNRPPVIVLDELHGYPHWRDLLKGFFDRHGERCRIIVTGSARLDVFRRGGDSLMGRYFPYRMHPLSVAELVHRGAPGEDLVRPPRHLAESDFDVLFEYGGFPEPYLHRSRTFSLRWQRLRHQQLFREDLRDLTRVQALALLEVLGSLLADRSAEFLVFSNLAKAVRVSEETIRRWMETLTAMHYGFLVRPYHRNVAKALRKMPKWYLRDWSAIADPGRRAETFVACHLLKAVEGWSDLGLGNFELRTLRDKVGREVDLLVVRDDEPYILVEVKKHDDRLSPALAHFQERIGAPHAFQVVVDAPFVDADCFEQHRPIVVPARTFLSQLV